MAELKELLRRDLSAAIKSRDSVRVNTLRMALSAVSTEEVAGKEARELSDEDVRKVLAKEAKKREESAESFDSAGRSEQADGERAERDVLQSYLPEQLGDDELAEIVSRTLVEVTDELGERPGMKQMGQVMKAAQAKVDGRAEGGRVAGEVKRQLQQ